MYNNSVENWHMVEQEILPLMRKTAQALELDALNIDVDAYGELQLADRLIVITRRQQNKLIGYVLMLTIPSLRNVGTTDMAIDVIWVEPRHRKGSSDLLDFVKKIAKQKGANKLVCSSRMIAPIDSFLEKNNMTALEKVYVCEV